MEYDLGVRIDALLVNQEKILKALEYLCNKNQGGGTDGTFRISDVL